MNWYLVTIKDGSATAVKLDTPPPGENSGAFCVQAKNAADAQREGLRMFHRLARRKLRSERKAAGRCQWCNRKEDRGEGLRCSLCHELNTEYNNRHRGKLKGELVVTLKRSATAAEARTETRLTVLLEVRKAWERSGSIREFSVWLAEQIQRAQAQNGV